MQQKKTKLDYFIEAYSKFGLEKEATQVVASHVQLLSASGKLKAALAKHYGSHFAETFKSAKFQFNSPCHAYVKRAHVVPCFNAKVSTLSDIKDKKQKTLVSRKSRLTTSYKSKLAINVASGIILKVSNLLNSFEKSRANLTFKPSREFYDTLADVRATLLAYEFGKRETWEGFTMPDSTLMLSVQSTPIISWLLTDSPKHVETCFTALAKFEKSSQVDKIAEFDAIIDKLETSLCKRLHDDLAGKLLTDASQTPTPNWLDSVDIRHIVRGEYVTAEIGSETTPVKMLNSKEETARELAETDVRLSYSFESEECRTGIFAGIKSLKSAFEAGYKESDDKISYLTSFFTLNRATFLQSYLDSAIAAAIKGKGTADKSHLNDLNTLLSSFSLVISPRNGEQKNVGVLGASEIIHYVKFCAPWLSYKTNDGGWVESSKWEGLATIHRGNGFPVGNGQPCHYPAITLLRYLTVKKTVQAEVRITNRARKRHNESLNPKP